MSAHDPIISKSVYNPRLCEAQVAITHKNACYAFDLNPLFRFIDKYSYLLGAFLILAGLYLGLLGKKQFKISICLIGSVAFVLCFSLFLFTVFLSRSSPASTGWIIIGVCGFVGIFVGLALAYFSRIGAAVAAGWGGVTLGLILYNSFIYKLDNDKKVFFWIFMVLMGGICAGLTFLVFWHVIILATSFAGAYAVMRGISLYAGGFPGELEIIELIKSGAITSMPGAFYGYMAGFLVMSVLFAVWQFKRFVLDSESDKYGQKRTQHHYHAPQVRI